MDKLVVNSDFAKAHVNTFTRKDGAVVQAHDTKVQAKAKPGKSPDAPAAPQPGDVGHEEHQAYGVHFKPGDKVKDRYGKSHEVHSHVGPVVQTKGGESFHPTKLFRDGPMQKSVLMLDASLLKAHVDSFTRKDGTFVQSHDTSVQAEAPISKSAVRKHAVAAGAGSEGNVDVHGHSRPAFQAVEKSKGKRIVMTHKDHGAHVVVGTQHAQKMRENGYEDVTYHEQVKPRRVELD